MAAKRKKPEERAPTYRAPEVRREELSLEERAAFRARELVEAEAAVAAATDGEAREAAEDRLDTARRAHACGLGRIELEERERAAIELLSGNSTAEAARAFADRFHVDDSTARRWLSRACNRMRAHMPSVDVARIVALGWTERAISMAFENREALSAVKAIGLWARLAGCESPQKIAITTVDGRDALPPEVLELLRSPQVQAILDEEPTPMLGAPGERAPQARAFVDRKAEEDDGPTQH